jgi:hypothetical protein
MSSNQQQLPLPAEWADADDLVVRFEARLRSARLIGLTLWTGCIRDVLHRLFAREQNRRRAAYEQLMLLEEELGRSATREVVLTRIGQIKGLLLVGVFLFALFGSDTIARGIRRRGRGRGRDEIECIVVEEV